MKESFKLAAALVALAALAACGGSDPVPEIEDLGPKWCWSMQSGNLLGTFRTSGSIPGDGTASAGIYTLLDFSVIQSSFVDIEVGSVSDGTYAFGNQPDYQIDWNGSAVSVFQRGSLGTLYTNGFGINNGAGGAGAYLSFDVGYQAGSAAYGGTSLFTDSTTPAVTPVGSSGMCPGEGDS